MLKGPVLINRHQDSRFHGKRILTLNQDSTVRLLPCDVCGSPDEVIAAIKRRVARELTDEEHQLYGLPPRGTEHQPGRSGKSAQATR
jgi:hypothetical protein